MSNQPDYRPEERDNPELVRQLSDLYQTNPADRQSLARIRERLHHYIEAQPSSESSIGPETSIGERGTVRRIPIPTGRETGSWKHRLNLIAAVFFAALVVGSLLFVFSTIRRSNVVAPQQPTFSVGIPLSPSPELYLTDTQTAWLSTLASIPYDADIPAPLLRTSDGGKTWQDVTPPQLDFESYAALYALNGSTAWVKQETGGPDASATFLLHTIDGGKTWQQYRLPATLSSNLNFVDSQHGWLLSAQKATGTQPSRLYATSDGGKTWQPLITNPSDPLYLVPVSTQVQFVDAQNGWMVVPDVTLVNSEVAMMNEAGRKLYVTHDGGHSWQQLVLPKTIWPPKEVGTTSAFFYVKFLSAQDGYLIIKSPAGSAPSTWTLYPTHDGGKTWQQSQQISFPAPVSLSGISIGRQIRITTQQKILFYTLANGRWTQTAEEKAPTGKHFIRSQFASSTVGLALVGDRNQKEPQTVMYRNEHAQLLKTTDGGASWTPLNVVPPTSRVTPATMSYLTNPGWTYFTGHKGSGPETFTPEDQRTRSHNTLPDLSARKWLVRFMCKVNTAQLALNGQSFATPGCNQHPVSTIVTFSTPQPVKSLTVQINDKQDWLVVFEACTNEKLCQPDTL